MNKTPLIALLIPLAGCSLPAQTTVVERTVVAPPEPAAPAAAVAPQPLFTAEQLDTLLGPIALYPDALIALMLPASTNPSDIVLAARFLAAGGDAAQLDGQPWDDSVRALARYPQVVKWMDENLAWTKQLGDAVAYQSEDVMNAIQRLRGRAKAAGTLVSTPEQQVLVENSVIVIVPAQPDVIYVPYYDPVVVYTQPRHYPSYPHRSYFGFSSGLAAGWWLAYGLDWGNRCVVSIDRGHRERFWRDHRQDWHRPHHWNHWRDRDHRDDRVHVWTPPRRGYRPPGGSRYRQYPSDGNRDRPGTGYADRRNRDEGREREDRRPGRDRGGDERVRENDRSRPGWSGSRSSSDFVGPVAPRTQSPLPSTRIRNREPTPAPPLALANPTPAPTPSRGEVSRRDRGSFGRSSNSHTSRPEVGPSAPAYSAPRPQRSLPSASLGMPVQSRSPIEPRSGPPSYRSTPIREVPPLRSNPSFRSAPAPAPAPAAPPAAASSAPPPAREPQSSSSSSSDSGSRNRPDRRPLIRAH